MAGGERNDMEKALVRLNIRMGKGGKSDIKKGKRMYMTHKFLIYMLFLAKNDIFAKRIG